MGQKPSVESALSLVGNRLSGPLPSIFYSFYYDAATTLTYFSAKDNHFRCSARPAPAARVGDEITVAGEAFAATTESTQFTYDAGGSDVVPAFYYGGRGTLPEDAPTGDCVVAVANYGDDYSDATTLGDYAAVTFEIYPPESSKKKSDDTTAILAGAGANLRRSAPAAAATAAPPRQFRSTRAPPRHRAAPPQAPACTSPREGRQALFMPLSQSPLHPAETELAPPASASEVALKDDVDGGRMSTIPL
ncbi:hypothetical protein JL721_10132 [Aureococcus anophagefferens]|nr:hypothetical protein JL721_10132 [Aureococcus anophagefferens]